MTLELRAELVHDDAGQPVGWRWRHDGPHEFEASGQCPCGVWDVGVIPSLQGVQRPPDDEAR